MSGIVLVVACAVLIEALVEYGKSVGKLLSGQDIKAGVTQLCAVVVGIAVCMLTGADIFSSIGITLYLPYAGCIFTGIFASRGANYVSDLVSKLARSRTT